MIYQLIINTLTGAGTGYITNNIAIKMLFKKYFGRFGGIIEDTHDEFVENISKLIEKDLINHHTLKDEFNSAKFHSYIKTLVEDMFVHTLPKNSINLRDIDGIDKTTQNILNFLDDNRKSRKDLKKEIASKPLKSAISYKQLLHLSKNIADVLDINKESYIKEFTDAIKGFSIDSLLTEELLQGLIKNLDKIIYNINLYEFDKEIDESVYKLLEYMKIDEIINFTQEEIENLYFKDMFIDSNESTKDLIKRLLEIAISDEGQIAIAESVNAILMSLSKLEISVLSLFDDEIKDSIKLFIKNELPNIIQQIIEFMDKNEKDLEFLINDSIDKALDEGMFSDLKKKIVSIFYTNIVADFKVLSMIKGYIYQYKDLAEEEISSQIIYVLEEKSIGEIYQAISSRNIINTPKVVSVIIRNLQNFKVDRNLPLIDTVLQKQVKDYTDVDLGFVQEKLIPYSLKRAKIDFIYSTKIKDFISKETKTLIDDFKAKSIEDVLAKKIEFMLQKIENSIDKDTILDIILQKADSIFDKPINELVNIEYINLDYKHYINEMIEGKSIKDIIVHLNSQEVYEAVKNALIKVVNDNLEEILKDNVSEAVKNELAKLPPSQIKDMVEEFMGEELKPINYFGAILGGMAGAGVGFVSIPVWANPFIYAIVGVATNYLAIKMLFQPYKPLKIAKMKVPFSEGVLPSNKKKMAIKMSEFVDEFMLNGTSIHEFFLNNSENLKSFIKVHISKDDYAIIDKIIHQNSNISDISNTTVNLIFNFLDKNQDIISDKIFEISMSYFDKREDYSKELSDILYKESMRRDFSEFLYEQFERFVDREISLEFAKDELFLELDRFIQRYFYDFLDTLSDSGKIKKIVTSFEDSFDEFISHKSLLDTIDRVAKERVSKKINTSLLELFYAEETFDELLNFFTKGEFSSQSKLSDMINGMLPRIIENNLKLLINELILPALKEQKKRIRKEIMKKVPFGIGWAVKRDVNRTINIILDKKIPLFLDEKIKEINKIVQETLNTQLIQLGYTKDVINQTKVDDMMRSVITNKNFEASFARAMNVFVDTIFNMKLKIILQIFNIKTLSEIYDLFEPNIINIAEKIRENVQKEQDNILETVKYLTKDEIAITLLKRLKLLDILEDIDKDLLIKEFSYLEKRLKESKEFEKSMRAIISNFIERFIKKEFLDMDIFRDDLEIFLKEIIKDKEQLRDILVPFFQEFIVNANNILDTKLKEHLLSLVIDSAFESIDKKIMDLILAVDFKKVITKEIQEMHPKELEDMFYSFAGAYFNKLILYGSLGFLFGLGTIF